MTDLKKELTESKKKELKRVIELLNSKGKEITKNNILLYADRRIINGSWLSSMPKRELLAEVMKKSPVNSAKKDVAPAVKALAKEKHQKCFIAFKKLIDSMVEAGIELTNSNIVELKNDSFNDSFWYQNKEAKAYLADCRKKTGYKARTGRKAAESKKTVSKAFSDKEVFTVKTLDAYDITYLKDVINFLFNENGTEKITAKNIVAAIPDYIGKVFTETQISTCKPIMAYIAVVNDVVEKNSVYNKVKKTLAAMAKEGVAINRYTVINRLRGEVTYDQFKTNPKLDTLIRDVISVKEPSYVG